MPMDLKEILYRDNNIATISKIRIWLLSILMFIRLSIQIFIKVIKHKSGNI